jgi:hypothetical protein
MLTIKGNRINYKDNNLYFEDLFTSDFLNKANNDAVNYLNSTYYVNELYYSYILPYQAIVFFIKKTKIKRINFSKANLLLKCICIDISNNNFDLCCNSRINWFYKVGSYFFNLYHLTITFLYLIYKMILIPYCNNKTDSKIIALSRSQAGNAKLRNFNLVVEYENIANKKSIYRLFRLKTRILWVLKSFYNSFNELFILQELITNYIGKNTSYIASKYYSKRLVHTLLYNYLINDLFNNNKYDLIYTTSNLDRFSVIEEFLANKYNINTVCIPHGLEYGFKFPKGFSGHIHYTTTEYAAHFLNSLYETNKFIWDTGVANKMFRIEGKSINNGCKIIFFTESREIAVNIEIIEKLAPMLNKKSIDLYLKLHPDDNPNNYKKLGIKLLTNLESALVGNICISRKSTVLLEATYNDSIAAAILINEKDKSIFSTFPSLNSKNINVFYSIEDLFTWLCNKYNKYNS